LLGHSFGGWVAFEIALLLKAAGRQLASLTLIDSVAPAGEKGRGQEYTRTEVLMRMVEIWEMAAESHLGIARETIEALGKVEQLSLLHERLVSASLMPQRSRPDALVGPVRTFGAAVRCGYQPSTAYIGPVNLVLLADSRLDEDVQRHRFEKIAGEWRRWAPDLDVWHGPGNHMTALKSPNVRKFADWLRTKLDVTPPAP
jgi:thioesterase domain-containing protein